MMTMDTVEILNQMLERINQLERTKPVPESFALTRLKKLETEQGVINHEFYRIMADIRGLEIKLEVLEKRGGLLTSKDFCKGVQNE